MKKNKTVKKDQEKDYKRIQEMIIRAKKAANLFKEKNTISNNPYISFN